MPTSKKEVANFEKKPIKKNASITKKAVAKKSISQTKSTSKTKKEVKSTAKLDNTVLKKTKEKSLKPSERPTSKSTRARKAKVTKVPSLLSVRRKAKADETLDNTKETSKDFANILEYYDLPYRYNETVVKILAQTPKILFVYWDISDKDREKYKEEYGEYFFNDTYPVLIIHNKTLNYSQEIEINDFANSWYINLSDSRSEYYVELGRRFKDYAKRNPKLPPIEDVNSVISVTASNNLVMPNDHVLLEEIKPRVKYRNVKTNEETYKDTQHILANNKLIDFYSLYKEIYQVENLSNVFSLSNPSSGNPTSTFK